MSTETNTQTDEDRMTLEELHTLEEGGAVELQGTHGDDTCREYLVAIDGVIYGIGSSRIRVSSVDGAHFQMAHAHTVRQTTIEEAYGFFHGDYEPDVTYACMSCGSETGSNERKQCGCPVGSRISEVDFPEVTPRQPRCTRNGELLAKPN